MNVEGVGAEAAAELAATHARSFPTAWSAEDIAALIEMPGGFALAVRREGDIRGFLLGRAVAGEAEVLTVAVDPQSRRGGLGRTLLEAAMSVALAAGAESLFLEVAADNAPAISLYQQAGFAWIGRRPAYYARPDGPKDALVMRLDLNTGAG